MTLEQGAWLAAIMAPTIVASVAWGDMRRRQTSDRELTLANLQQNRERQDERHEENQEILHEIRDDVKRINGTVQRHRAVLKANGFEGAD